MPSFVEHVTQDSQTLKTYPQSVSANTLKVVPTRLLSTSPIAVTHYIFAAGGKLVASCSASVTFNQNLFYTTVRVVPDTTQSSGYSCSAW